jgi:two-component system, sensor histidine kinase ChiS
MKNPAKNNYFLLKSYSVFVLATLVLGISSASLLIFFTISGNKDNDSQILKKEASNIQKTISESFNYSNKINSYIGKQIAEHGVKDLEFILKTFKQADQIQNKNTQLLSWSSFDWVDPNNLQLVNSKVGIRKNPPNMSARQYCQRSPNNPWTLQVSFPVLGNPSESWVVPAGTGITDKNNKYLGSVVVGFNLSELSTMVEQRLNDPVSFVVLDEDMNLIIQSSDNELEESQNFYKRIDKSFFSKKSSFLKEEITASNVSYSFYQKFDDYPYIVLTGFNKAFLKKEFNSSIMPIIIGFASITLFFLIILYIFKTRILILMTRERKLRNSLHNTNISKTKLIRAASHDLKNYIFGISGLSKLILQDKKKSEIETNEDLKMIEEISSQSEELMGFVEDLLDTNQNESGGFVLGKMQVCDIAILSKRMVILNKNFALENHIILEVINSSTKNNLNIKCDVRRIKQILNNLISNSIKYSPAETKVVIETSFIKETDEVCICVSDSGIGMTEKEIVMALSGDGEQIDKSALEKEIDSHGIGMPIIKKLAELHNGRIEIKSKKGFGTKIKIYFKADHSKKEDSNNNKTDNENLINLFKSKSVLLAEDNPVGKKINTHLLRRMGFKVKHVENGQEIVKELDKNHYDLVFMDINMPILNGFEAAKIIREGLKFKKFKNTNIPIIAITADKPELSKLKYYGIDVVVDKPFSEKEILDVILEYVKK